MSKQARALTAITRRFTPTPYAVRRGPGCEPGRSGGDATTTVESIALLLEGAPRDQLAVEPHDQFAVARGRRLAAAVREVLATARGRRWGGGLELHGLGLLLGRRDHLEVRSRRRGRDAETAGGPQVGGPCVIGEDERHDWVLLLVRKSWLLLRMHSILAY